MLSANPHDVEAAVPRHPDALVPPRAHVGSRDHPPLSASNTSAAAVPRAPDSERCPPATQILPPHGAHAKSKRGTRSGAHRPTPAARVVPDHVAAHVDVGVAVLAAAAALPPAQPAADDVDEVAERDDGEALQHVAVGDAGELAHAAPRVGPGLVALEAVRPAKREARVYPDPAAAAAAAVAVAAAPGAGEGRRGGSVAIK